MRPACHILFSRSSSLIVPRRDQVGRKRERVIAEGMKGYEVRKNFNIVVRRITYSALGSRRRGKIILCLS